MSSTSTAVPIPTPPIEQASALGDLRALRLRQRLLQLLAQVTYSLPQEFLDVDDLYHMFVEAVHDLPFETFCLLVCSAHADGLSDASRMTLCERLLEKIIDTTVTPSKPTTIVIDDDSVDGDGPSSGGDNDGGGDDDETGDEASDEDSMTQDKLEQRFLPFPAHAPARGGRYHQSRRSTDGSSELDRARNVLSPHQALAAATNLANAKVSVLLETMLRLLLSTGLLQPRASLTEAVERGIAVREARTGVTSFHRDHGVAGGKKGIATAGPARASMTSTGMIGKKRPRAGTEVVDVDTAAETPSLERTWLVKSGQRLRLLLSVLVQT
ncbi:hypothetical protein KEM52_002192 [Ascosphaera acerosa]|nr:hypothetical protein KEM52_002192 [Ascosphaera acerosa]